MTTKRLIIGAGFVLAVIAVITARAHVGAPAAAAGATSSVPPVIPTSAPRGPTAPAATYPNGTIVPAGGYYTTTNGTPISSLANGPFTAPSGIPAITPTLSNVGPLTPTFTAQDAINYITRHDVGAKVHAMGSVTVAKVSFLPNRDTVPFSARSWR